MTLAASSLPAFLSGPPKRLLIGGEQLEPLEGETFDTPSPATGAVAATLARGREADVDRAVAAARRAFEGPWAAFTPAERQAVLLRLADLVEQHSLELGLIEAVDTGVPIANIGWRTKAVVDSLRWFSAQARTISGRTVANSLPGMFHLHGEGAGRRRRCDHPVQRARVHAELEARPVLATGCTVVSKACGAVSRSAPLRLGELCLEAGIPRGRRQRRHRPRRSPAQRLPPILTSTWSLHRLGRDRAQDRRGLGREPQAADRWSWAANRPTSSSPTPISTRPCRLRRWPSSANSAARSASRATRLFVRAADL